MVSHLGNYLGSTWLEVLFEKRIFFSRSVQGLLYDDVYKNPYYFWFSLELMANLSIAIFMKRIDFQFVNCVISKD